MKFLETPIAGLFVVELEPVADARGSFARTYCKREFARTGFTGEWVQLNHSHNRAAGTFRGFHFFLPPLRETKLIRVVAGAVLDTVIDLRKNSSTLLQKFSLELSAENQKSFLIPPGLAHGFSTLCDDTALVYHHSEFYSRDVDAGLRYDDPILGFQSTVPITMISDRDRNHALLPEGFAGFDFG